MATRKQIENETREILKSINKMPPFPAVVTKILDMVQSESYNIKELESVIQLDPIITAKCLKLCNSAYFGLRKKIDSIQQAVIIIGEANLLKIIMATAAGSINFKSKGLWMHSVAVAFLSQLLFTRFKEDPKVKDSFKLNDEFTLYTCSLLHDVGRIVLDQFMEKDYSKVEILQMRGICNLSDIEKELFGVNHSIIGAEILRKWEFPENMINLVQFHHVALNKLPLETISIKHVLCLANILHFTYLWCEEHSKAVIDDDILTQFNLNRYDLETLKFELYKELSDADELLQLETEFED